MVFLGWFIITAVCPWVAPGYSRHCAIVRAPLCVEERAEATTSDRLVWLRCAVEQKWVLWLHDLWWLEVGRWCSASERGKQSPKKILQRHINRTAAQISTGTVHQQIIMFMYILTGHLWQVWCSSRLIHIDRYFLTGILYGVYCLDWRTTKTYISYLSERRHRHEIWAEKNIHLVICWPRP